MIKNKSKNKNKEDQDPKYLLLKVLINLLKRIQIVKALPHKTNNYHIITVVEINRQIDLKVQKEEAQITIQEMLLSKSLILKLYSEIQFHKRTA